MSSTILFLLTTTPGSLCQHLAGRKFHVTWQITEKIVSLFLLYIQILTLTIMVLCLASASTPADASTFTDLPDIVCIVASLAFSVDDTALVLGPEIAMQLRILLIVVVIIHCGLTNGPLNPLLGEQGQPVA